MFRIPYYYPPWNPGQQVVNLGEGGPSSHMGLQAMQPRVHPIVYDVGTYGLGTMPRQVMGPTLPVTSNNLSNPRTIFNLLIPGLFKNPVGG